MHEKYKDKIALFRVLHGVNEVWISNKGQVYLKKPDNFYGKYIGWHENGVKWYEHNYKNGEWYGKWIEWYENGDKSYENNYKEGELIG